MDGLLVEVGARVTVAAEDAKLMRGGDVVGTLEKGLSFEVTRMIDGWPPRRTYDRVAPPAVRLRPGSLQRLGQPLDRGRQFRDHHGLAFPLRFPAGISLISNERGSTAHNSVGRFSGSSFKTLYPESNSTKEGIPCKSSKPCRRRAWPSFSGARCSPLD
jgi:hypothetical protein